MGLESGSAAKGRGGREGDGGENGDGGGRMPPSERAQ